MPGRSGLDRRTRRTHGLLHGALASLVHERAYDDIAVKDILARADVARSTFYAHYRDKDELLERGMRAMLRADAPAPAERWCRATDRVLRFSLPFLEQIERGREHGALSLAPSAAATLHEHLRRVLECLVADELRVERRRRRAVPADAMPAELLARHVAATFVVALGWWIEHRELSAREVDARFRQLVAPALAPSLPG